MPDPRLSPADRRAALAGVLAAGLTVAVAHLLAVLLGSGGSPLLAVGGAVVDRVPAWLKDLAIAAFGTADKLVLLVGECLVLALLGAAVGVLARRRPAVAAGLVVTVGVLGAVVAAGRADAGRLAPLPTLVGAAAGAVVLRGLVARAAPAAVPAPGTPPQGVEVPSAPADPTRRGFLTAAGAVAAVAVLAAASGTVLDRSRQAAARARDLVRLPRPARPAPPLPAGVAAPVEGVGPFLTPNRDFYRIDTALAVPRVDPATWRLRVHGMVEREVELDLPGLLAADLVEARVTLVCVSNPVGGDLAGNATWLGLPVRELLGRARPLPGADMVLSTSADGFTASTPLEALTDDRDALLAVGMNGEPLPPEHGFPVRMVVPGLYGYVSATKWLVDLEVTTFAARTAYWTTRGWSARGPVKVASRIEVPRSGDDVRAGVVAVGGTAWAQHRGVAAVEVQVDSGPWVEVELAAEDSVDTWRQWAFRWDASDVAPGRHTLRVRARTADGELQTGERAEPAPDGATGWHAVEVDVRA